MRFNARTEGLAVRGDYGAGDGGESYIFANESQANAVSSFSLSLTLSPVYLILLPKTGGSSSSLRGGEEGLPRRSQARVEEEEKEPLGGSRMGELVSSDQPSPPCPLFPPAASQLR